MIEDAVISDPVATWIQQENTHTDAHIRMSDPDLAAELSRLWGAMIRKQLITPRASSLLLVAVVRLKNGRQRKTLHAARRLAGPEPATLPAAGASDVACAIRTVLPKGSEGCCRTTEKGGCSHAA